MDPVKTLDSLPRLRLCQLPTPIHRMSRLEQALGLTGRPELWIKRDDLTGLAFGGNKGRKLEFALAEARGEGAEVVFTSGGNQSNHCRQTAVAATALGFEVHLFLSGSRPERMTGNLLPSAICGAQLHFLADHPGVTRQELIEQQTEVLRALGRRVYVIPVGASYPTGAMGYVNAAREIRSQQQQLGAAFEWIVTATGSGGTQFGLLVGAALFALDARVLGFAVSPVEDLAARKESIAAGAARTAEALGLPPPAAGQDVLLDGDYAGEGYAVPTAAGRDAIELLARTEGIFLDPTYTAKAMSGLLAWVRTGRLAAAQRVLFVHTGGSLALFA